jgi:hypothetical protein
MVPYIFLDVKTGSSLPHHTRWTFPALRAAGGFPNTTMMQLIIQKRITTLARRWISEHCSNRTPIRGKSSSHNMHDVESKPRNIGASADILQATITKETAVTDSNLPLTWFLLVLLILGVLASVVGYVSCFSVVQDRVGRSAGSAWRPGYPSCECSFGVTTQRLATLHHSNLSSNVMPLHLFQLAMSVMTSLWRRRCYPLPVPINFSIP